MARDHRPDEQDSLFSPANGSDGEDVVNENPGDAAGESLSSEEERLRNGDIAFRPVALPGAEPEPETRRGGGTALMIVVAIVVVFLVTYVIYTFYSPAPGPADQAAERELLTADDPAEEEAEPLVEPGRAEPGGAADSAAVFQAHAELQEQYRKSEARVIELEAELATLRAGSTVSPPAGETASPVDDDRLTRLEDENRKLKADLDSLRRESESAVSRAERLVQRAEARIAEEKNLTTAARNEVETLAAERDGLREQVGRQETELIDQRAEFERLSATTTTRLEGESEAVRQLISRHADELERQARITREKETEIQRLNQLIARLSVTQAAATPETRAPATATRSASSVDTDGSVSPPRILTRKEPVYPVNARRLRVEGTVLLNVLVGVDGMVREVKVLEAEGGKLLSPAAVDAVRQWTFTPATRGGQPVQCWHKVPIRFAL